MAEGYITKIDKRATKFGDYYDIYVGNDKLGAGKFPPKGINVGDFVKYEVEMNGQYKNLKRGTLEKVDPPAGVAPPTPPKPSSISLDRQDVISRQAALNTAIQFLQVLQAEGAIPSGAKSLKADEKADKIEAVLWHYVQKFYAASTMTEYEVPESLVEGVAEDWNEE